MRYALGLFITFLYLSLGVANAEVDYVSLSEVESPERQPLFLRVNLIEKGRSLPLRFTLLTEGVETEMAYHRLNDFMVRLASQRIVQGKATVFVYQFDGKQWARVANVDVSNDLKPIQTAEQTPVKQNVAQVKAETYDNTETRQQAGTSDLDTKLESCQITREHKETLWSIASRYKDQWQVDVFSAMIAIYKSNLTKFNQGHINQLIDGAELVCPSRAELAKTGEKEAMRTEFFRLKALKP